ncbi:MAG: dependent protein [Bacteroidota bacterium]|nr:dependent protein [Bacteroidota bacterium]
MKLSSDLPSSDIIAGRAAKIKEDINEALRLTDRLTDNVEVIAVTKTFQAELIIEALKAGLTDFGENYVQEIVEKEKHISENWHQKPHWHFIGHLQTNKVKSLFPYISVIHSVDSLHLAQEISKQSCKWSKQTEILLQVNTSGEDSKHGCHPDEIFKLFDDVSKLKDLKIKGLMTIGSFSNDEMLVRGEFKILRELRDEINRKFGEPFLYDLSMGMSGDYIWAVEEGATFVRVGTGLFGSRNYSEL